MKYGRFGKGVLELRRRKQTINITLINLFPPNSLRDGELRTFFQRSQKRVEAPELPFSKFSPVGTCTHVHHKPSEDGKSWDVVRCTEMVLHGQLLTGMTIPEVSQNGFLCLSHQGDVHSFRKTDKAKVDWDKHIIREILNTDGQAIVNGKVRLVGLDNGRQMKILD